MLTTTRGERQEKMMDTNDVPTAPVQARGKARKRAILDRAMSLFAMKGFNKVSLAELADSVGVTQAGLLYYFPTKADLLLAVLQERDDRWNEGKRDGSFSLESYFRVLASNDENPELVRLFVVVSAEALDAEHPGHTWMRERDTRVMSNMVSYVEDTLDVNKLPDRITPEVVARWILALSSGLGEQWIRVDRSFDRADYVARLMILLEPYLKDRPSDEATSKEARA
jgi:AcrR family transcriptional regulator